MKKIFILSIFFILIFFLNALSQDFRNDEILIAFYINLPNEAAINGISHDKLKSKIKETCIKYNFTPLFYDKNKSEFYDHILVNIYIDKKKFLVSATKIKIIKDPGKKDIVLSKGAEWNYENFGLLKNKPEKIYAATSNLIERILIQIRQKKIKL